MRYQ